MSRASSTPKDMSTHYREPSISWTQNASSASLYHHNQARYTHHRHHQPVRPEASSQPGWPSLDEWKAKAEQPRRPPPELLKLPHPAQPADEADLSKQLDQVVDLLSQQPRSDGGPRRPMNAFLIFARWRRRQLAQADTSLEAPLWTSEARKRRKAAATDLGLKPSDVSTALGVEWRGLTPQQQAPFLRKAGELRNDFDRRHPDYKFRRGPKGAAKIRRQERRERIAEARRRPQAQKATVQDGQRLEAGYDCPQRDADDEQRTGLASHSTSSAGRHFKTYQHCPPGHERRSFSLSDAPPETPILDIASLSPYVSGMGALPYQQGPEWRQPSEDMQAFPTVFGSSNQRLYGEVATLPHASETALNPRSKGSANESSFWPISSRTDLPPLHNSLELLAPTLHNGRSCTPTYSNSLAASSLHTNSHHHFDYEGATSAKRSGTREPPGRSDAVNAVRFQSRVTSPEIEAASFSTTSTVSQAAAASALDHGHGKPIGCDLMEHRSRVSTFFRSLPPASLGRQQVPPSPVLRLHLSESTLAHKKYHQQQQQYQRHQQQQRQQQPQDYRNIGSYRFPAHGPTSSNSGRCSSNGNGRPVPHISSESSLWTPAPAREHGLQTLSDFHDPMSNSTSSLQGPTSLLHEAPKLSRRSSTLEAALHFPNSSLSLHTKSDPHPKLWTKPSKESQLQCSSRLVGGDVDEKGQRTQNGPSSSR